MFDRDTHHHQPPKCKNHSAQRVTGESARARTLRADRTESGPAGAAGGVEDFDLTRGPYVLCGGSVSCARENERRAREYESEKSKP